MLVWNNTLLSPVLITFNRAQHVEKTLVAFLKAGLTGMRFHVLDNCSTDNTQAVVTEIQQHWPNLHYHKNLYNIGGNANILRALELSDSEYHWVIGDDDQWYLDDLGELMAVLNKAEADIIRLGWLVSEQSRGKMLTAQTLIEQEQIFFGSTSMISATIIRRNLMSRYLRQAYSNISNFYPQLIPIILGVQSEKVVVYTIEKDLMLHTPSTEPGSLIGDLQWYTVWYKTSLFFEQLTLRKNFNQETIYYIKTISQHKKTRLPCWLFFTRQALNFKSLGFKQGRYLAEIFLYGAGVRRYFIVATLSYLLIPRFLAHGLRELYRKIYKLPKKNIIRDDSR